MSDGQRAAVYAVAALAVGLGAVIAIALLGAALAAALPAGAWPVCP